MTQKKISLPLAAGADTEPMTSLHSEDPFARIEHDVTTHSVVLYMKGTLQQPMCGFSAKAAAILQSYGVDVYAVNVLADPAIRQAVKEYSDWPTIPQVYINGEFLGGSDLLGQMAESGQLDALMETVSK